MNTGKFIARKGSEVARRSQLRFQFSRIRQMLWVTEIALCVALVNNIYFYPGFQPVVVIAGSILLLSVSFFALHKNNLQLAISILIWTLLIALTYLIITGRGSYDAGILAYPGILIYSAMLSPRRQFVLVCLFILFVSIFVGLAGIRGWIVFEQLPADTGHLIDTTIILIVIGFSAWLLTVDLNKGFRLLDAEVERVKKSQARIQHIANYDQLTGLPNRILCRDRYRQSLAHSARNESLLAFVFLDLDDFKQVNDTLGHDVGDSLLKAVAERLTTSVRVNDTVSREGGDEFLVILESMPNEDRAVQTARKILTQLQEPFHVSGQRIEITASIGISIAPNDGKKFEVIQKNADIAMYRAKEDGKNTFRFFNNEMQQQAKEQFDLVNQLREASRSQEFRLLYQPKIHLSENRIVGAEALIRWQHPGKNEIAPSVFIPIAESSGLIEGIGEWVINEACRACAHWHAIGYSDFSVAVNLSVVQFRRANLQDIVEKALTDNGLEPRFLELELKESLLGGGAYHVKEQIRDIGRLGVKFSIDGFGTGYSKIGYLRELDISVLKIDCAFIRDLLKSRHAASLVSGIIQLARSLELTVVAEGIEDEQTLQKLIQQKCELGQGHYWSRPLSDENFESYLHAQGS